MTSTRTTTTKPAPAETFRPGASYRRVLEKSHRRAVHVALASRDVEQLETIDLGRSRNRG